MMGDLAFKKMILAALIKRSLTEEDIDQIKKDIHRTKTKINQLEQEKINNGFLLKHKK